MNLFSKKNILIFGQTSLKAAILIAATAILSAVLLTTACTAKNPPPEMATPQPVAGFDDEIRRLQDTANTQPSYANYINLGLKFGQAQRPADAVEAYKKAVALGPNIAVGYSNMCWEYYRLHNYPEAVASCEKAVKIDPKFNMAQNNLASAKFQLSEKRKWLIDQKKELLASSSPKSEDVVNLARDLYAIGEFKMVVEVSEKIKPGQPYYAQAQNNMGSAYIMLKDYDQAQKALDEASRLEPQNQLFQNNKKWLSDARATK